jgi:hypothetical protein
MIAVAGDCVGCHVVQLTIDMAAAALLLPQDKNARLFGRAFCI